VAFIYAGEQSLRFFKMSARSHFLKVELEAGD
jgi:hypothetical protein